MGTLRAIPKSVFPLKTKKEYIYMPFYPLCIRKMPFGLHNVLATFQQCMVSIFFNLLEKCLAIFMDGFSVYKDSFKDCLTNLGKVLRRCWDII